jgi:hypothetical protein
MKTIAFDDSRWPLVIIRYGTEVDEQEFEELLRLLDENIKRSLAARHKTCVIYDSTSGYQASPRIRKRQAEWMKQQSMATRVSCAGIAFVITSAMVRGVLTAVLWLSELPTPYTVVGSMHEAERWCEKQLAQHGFALPARELQARSKA